MLGEHHLDLAGFILRENVPTDEQIIAFMQRLRPGLTGKNLESWICKLIEDLREKKIVRDIGRVGEQRFLVRPGKYLPAGICKKCGCTERFACKGGCSWADKEHRLCTRCE